ncbi:MAG: D-alanyl-D-alanine carboxypeptidase [Rhodobacteraceae bacterium]|nr:D-alanyl-D-alanine carboxypeptidase [Paracoccaceae bacterium]
MTRLFRQGAFALLALLASLMLLAAGPAQAVPYAAMVMDARTGEVLHARNADTRLHPASLTKMMTLYVAFDAIQRGEITLDTEVRVSPKAASEPPSRLGLRPGQRIALRYLIRAAAIRSANDAATAIAEAISGSEAAFTQRMDATARALGMNSTTFKNAHGLTQEGHLSTARDMTILGRRLYFDYPQYYNLFGRISTDAGVATVQNTNRRLLQAYRGSDGIKTGYTRAAGFNLVASAQRGNVRVIATVFGGRSAAWRNDRVAELMDLGFRAAPANVAIARPAPAHIDLAPGTGTRVARSGAVARSPRAAPRPAVSTEMLLAVAAEVKETVSRAATDDAPGETLIVAATTAPPQRPEGIAAPEATASEGFESKGSSVEDGTQVAALAPAQAAAPAPRGTAFLRAPVTEGQDDEGRVIVRASTSGGRYWGITLGLHPSRHHAERVLLRTALTEMETLDGALRKVVPARGRFEASFVGMTREEAERACVRLRARQTACEAVGPEGT